MTDVVIYQFSGAYGMRSLSPFCTKLETYLRLAGISYRSRLGDPRQAPMGKLPYADIGGERIGDSGAIIERCRALHDDALDAALSAEQRAIGHLARRCAEEHLYWGLLCARWVDDNTWKSSYRRAIADALPRPVRAFLPGIIRRGVRKSTVAHGLGRHDPTEVTARVRQDLDALAATIGDKPFLLGDAPSSFDCSVYAMLEHLRCTPAEHPTFVAMREHAALVGYCERMNERIAWE
jgi:glutathione S-transferase